MTERRMLILPAELVNKINENRGDLSNAEFISFMIDGYLKKEAKETGYVTKEEIQTLKQDLMKLVAAKDPKNYATKEDMRTFQQDTKKLLKNFVDFFIGYGLELGKQSSLTELEELTSKLGDLDKDLPAEGGREVKIKYK